MALLVRWFCGVTVAGNGSEGIMTKADRVARHLYEKMEEWVQVPDGSWLQCNTWDELTEDVRSTWRKRANSLLRYIKHGERMRDLS